MSTSNEVEALKTRLDRLTQQLTELRAIEDIRQLKYRYFRAMDMADMALLRTLIMPDFHFDLRGSQWRLHGTNANDFVAKMTLNFNANMATQHHGHHPEISLADDGQSAVGIWYLQDIVHDTVSNNILFGTNFYDDHYILTTAGWRIASSQWSRHIEVRQQLTTELQYHDRYLADHGHAAPLASQSYKP